MKKLLLSMACVVLGIASMAAESFTLGFTTTASNAGKTLSTDTKVGDVINEGATNVSGFQYILNTNYSSGGYLRVGQNKAPGHVTFILAGDAKGVNATSVVVTCTGNKNANDSASVSINDGAIQRIPKSSSAYPADSDWKEYTFEVSGTLDTLCIATATAMVQVKSITVNYTTSGGPTAPSAPTISGETTFWGESTAVTISASSNCDVYYTLDGSTPTASSTKYSAPFAITATTTVKAIAVRDGLTSPVATATFTKGTPVNVTSIEDFLDQESGTVCKFTGKLTVVYQYKGYLFVKDATGGMQFFTGSINTAYPGTYNMGQTITGVIAKKDVYQNNPQAAVKDFLTSFPATAEGESYQIDPLVITADQVTNHLNEYVVLGSQTITKTGNYYYCGNVQLYNRFGLDALTDDYLTDKWDAAGFAVIYNTTPEIYYTAIDKDGVITGIDAIEAENASIYGSYGFIVAPEGASIYTVAGTATSTDNLPAGIYVVVYNGKATKVVVK